MLFYPKNKPLETCSSEDCTDCKVQKKINCHFNLIQLIHFCSVAIPSFIIGAVGLFYYNIWVFIIWFLIIIGFFMFAEIRVMCSHCPHYAEKNKSLKCWANYSIPKIWKYNPGPMTFIEKGVFLGGFVLVWGIPLIALIVDLQILLWILYVITTVGFFMTLQLNFCSICMNFACPLNRVNEEDRDMFFAKNPEIAKAWGKSDLTPKTNTGKS